MNFQDIIPVRSIYGHCGTGAVMNILNYFWGTNFGIKDTYDVEVLIRLGKFDWDERPSELEIDYYLAQMGFHIGMYEINEKGDLELFINNPNAHQNKHKYIPHPHLDIESNREIAKRVLRHENIELVEDTNIDLEQLIRQYSDGKHMFIFGVDRYVLYPDDINDTNEHPGHIIASLGYDENEKILILETSPSAQKIYKSFDEISKAMKALGGEGGVSIISLV